MRLGIDFDNTIVCYDDLFHRVALEDGVIPPHLPANKSDVRNHLRSIGREEVWTEMQGRVYGARMSEASPYPGVLEFFRAAVRDGIPVFIISHKTRRPFAGEPHDLHAAALAWLEARGFFNPAFIGLDRAQVFFELTKQAKLERIAACACSHFIDDLPELLAEPTFPKGVERLLFDPNALYRDEQRFTTVASWNEAATRLSISVRPANTIEADTAFASTAREFLGRHGITIGDNAHLPPLPGGANNRVYQVETPSTRCVLKRYFHAPEDTRDRFGAERAFYEWAWSHGVRRTPRPLAWDAEHRFGLFEWTEGRKLEPGEPAASHVQQAVAFLSELNADRHQSAAASIPIASEACLSLAEHLTRIDGRVARLAAIEADGDTDRAAITFATERLAPAWRHIRAGIHSQISGAEGQSLDPQKRCLSPSDFGFHNALVNDTGVVRFLDFEYAGWDDPAKLVGDFFCQPQVPVGLEHWDLVVDGLDRALGWNGGLAERAVLLLPAYRIKWCCILLNEFLRSDRARRTFAAGDASEAEASKATQLEKARRALVIAVGNGSSTET